MTHSNEPLPAATARKADRLELKIPPPVIAGAAAAVMWGLTRAFHTFDVPNGMRVPAAVLIALAGVVLAVSGIVTFRNAEELRAIEPAAGSAALEELRAAGLLVMGGVAAWQLRRSESSMPTRTPRRNPPARQCCRPPSSR